MPTRAVHIVIDATDPSALAAFWAAALGWEVAADESDEAVVWPTGFSYPGPAALPLVFVPVAEQKTGKNRLHLDLSTTSQQHQAAEVQRMLRLGATPADIGQGDVPWEVLADPEGNEFCVLDPRDGYMDARPVAAVVLDCARPDALVSFWADATGWDVHKTLENFASLRAPGGTGPFLELLQTPDTKTVKNRVHLDVAPMADGDAQAEARRLEKAGAVRLDIGQGDVSWVVLADPERNEFCVLSPR
ncbi:MAG: VOC family protein [Streptosporangiaceae bacterium]